MSLLIMLCQYASVCGQTKGRYEISQQNIDEDYLFNGTWRKVIVLGKPSPKRIEVLQPNVHIDDSYLNSRISFQGFSGDDFLCRDNVIDGVLEIGASEYKDLKLLNDTVSGSVEIEESNLQSATIYKCSIKNILIKDCHIENITFGDRNVVYKENGKISFGGNNQIGNSSFTNTIFKEMELHHSQFGNIQFIGCSFKSPIIFRQSIFGDSVIFENCSYPESIDLSKCQINGIVSIGSPTNTDKPTLIVGKHFPFEKVRFNYSYFNLKLDSSISTNQRQYFHRKLLEQQKVYGSAEDVAFADIDYKNELVKQGDVSLRFQRFLWLYGYDKALLLKRMMLFYLLFVAINLLAFKKLATQVYIVDSLVDEINALSLKKSKVRCWIRYSILSFIYSTIIFFGVKIEINKFKFKHLSYVMYFISFYLIGILFLFYFLGLILTK